jgi:hypothetical protein
MQSRRSCSKENIMHPRFRSTFLARLCAVICLAVSLVLTAPLQAQDLYVSTYDHKIVKITSEGVLVPIANGSGDGLRYPFGMTFSAIGDLYVVNNEQLAIGNTWYYINRVTPDGVICPFVYEYALVIGNSQGMVRDTLGNLYVSNATNSKIYKISTAGIVSVFADVPSPYGLAIDSTGNFYTAHVQANNIYRVTPNGSVTLFSNAVNRPYRLAFDADDNLFVASPETNSISKITPQGVVSTFASGGLLNGPVGLTFDASGNLYVANFSSNNILKYDSSGNGSVYFSGSGLSNPVYLAIAPPPVPTQSQISGTVALEQVSSAGRTLTVTLTPAGCDPVINRTVTLDANGAFMLTDIRRGYYTVRVKAAGADTTNGDVSGITVTLRGGDANGDNMVDITDLLLLIAHYNQNAPAAEYLEACDFNEDGSNDISDLLALIGNYNQMGD